MDRRPPPCPPGWRTDPPDFVGAGVQRAGTSWWFDELSRHLDVYRAPGVPKEIHFFNAFSDRRFTTEHVARDHRWVPRPRGGIDDEWTPCYIYDPWTMPHQEAVLDAFHRGLYSSQVARLLRYASRDRVLVLTYEEARSSPEPTLRSTAELLGLDPARFDGGLELREPHDRQKRLSRELSDELIPELTERYRDDLIALARLLPDLDLGRWPTSGGV